MVSSKNANISSRVEFNSALEVLSLLSSFCAVWILICSFLVHGFSCVCSFSGFVFYLNIELLSFGLHLFEVEKCYSPQHAHLAGIVLGFLHSCVECDSSHFMYL